MNGFPNSTWRGGLDLSAMVKSYRGTGSAGYHPVFVGAVGLRLCDRSSRKLERATYDSVAFRFIAVNEHPDHDTIATFRRRFLKDIEALFVRVLEVAREMGLLKLGTVALDGTKIHANASRHSALSYEHATKIEANAPTGLDSPRGWQPSADDISAFTDARVAGLKAGLKLTPAQEKNWPIFEQAYRDLAKVRTDQRRAFREQRQDQPSGTPQDVDPINRLQQRADALIARGTALKNLGAAAGPLYQSLDDGQKHRFVMLSRLMGRHHHDRSAAWHQQRGASSDNDRTPDRAELAPSAILHTGSPAHRGACFSCRDLFSCSKYAAVLTAAQTGSSTSSAGRRDTLRLTRRRRRASSEKRLDHRCGICDNVFMVWIVGVAAVVLYFLASIRVLRQYERRVVLFLGKFEGVRGPGLTLIFVPIQQMVRVSLRTVTMQIPSQKIITKDNVSIDIAAVAYYTPFTS